MVRAHPSAAWLAVVIRWAARLWGTAAALVVLAFFVEHLGWFGGDRLPPPSVMVAMGFHLMALVGLVLAWRWEVLGASLILAGAMGFVAAVGGGWRLLPVVSVVCAPALLWLCAGWLTNVPRQA
jgi:hypothetical protein